MHIPLQVLQILWFVYVPVSVLMLILWCRLFYLRGVRAGYKKRVQEEQSVSQSV